MPKSRRRKGARTKGALSPNEKRRIFHDGNPKRYYDPGKNPRPRNLLKDVQKAAAPRHDHRRGS
jgi:hypothetical protein